MFYNAKNNNIKLDDIDIDYVTFGIGEKTLVIIPGLADSLKSVQKLANFYALMYKEFAKNYKVYIFSRNNICKEKYTTKLIAEEYSKVFAQLQLKNLNIIGISQGGMIAQYLAINHSEYINKLALIVTTAKASDETNAVIDNWISLAKENKLDEVFNDTMDKSYVNNKIRPFYFIIDKMIDEKNKNKFILNAESCKVHNTLNELSKIKCPTLIIGGRVDKIIEYNSSIILSKHIKNSTIKIYDNLGHALYNESENFSNDIINFFN